MPIPKELQQNTYIQDETKRRPIFVLPDPNKKFSTVEDSEGSELLRALGDTLKPTFDRVYNNVLVPMADGTIETLEGVHLVFKAGVELPYVLEKTKNGVGNLIFRQQSLEDFLQEQKKLG